MDQVRVCGAPWYRGVEVYLLRHDDPVSPGSRPPPTAFLDLNAAQVLMDDLWSAGIRPTEGGGSAGSMSAVQEHLKDLRRMLFDDKRTQMVEISYPPINAVQK